MWSMKAGTDRIALTALVASAILGGGNGVGVRFSNRELDPLWGAGLRFGLAALVMLAVMAVFRLKLPRGRELAGAALFGALHVGAAFALVYFGLVKVHGGMGQLLVSVAPLTTLLLAAAWRQERITVAAVASTAPAIAGVTVLSWQALAGPVPVIYVLAVIAGGLCIAQAAVVARAFPPVHPVTMNAVGLSVGAAILLALSALHGDTWALPQHAETRLALVYLVLGGTATAFLLYLVVLRYWSASRTSYQAVLIPIVTVALSAWLDDEPIGAGLLIGGPLILAGVYFGAIRRPSRCPSPAGEPDLSGHSK
ncbi:DMT family transporter [Streptosporangiaceae bacterium NEAU-GS5]|nr:DMT family transporter [Streptosporangiaceae bacterium NEAU-GS5]